GVYRRRGFRSERTEAEAKQIELRPAGLRQSLPVAVNYSEDGGSRFSRAAGLEDQRQRALQVGVLNGNGRDVAVMHIFQWSNAVIVNPARPGRRRNDQYRAGEGAHSNQIGERQLSLVLGRTSRAEPGVDPDRLKRWATGKCLNIRLPWSLRDK